MTPTEGNPLPSRRALRKQEGWVTGAIDLPDLPEEAPLNTAGDQADVGLQEASPVPPQTPTEPRDWRGSPEPTPASPAGPTTQRPPLTRRERREQEQLLATGAVSVTPEPASEPSPVGQSVPGAQTGISSSQEPTPGGSSNPVAPALTSAPTAPVPPSVAPAPQAPVPPTSVSIAPPPRGGAAEVPTSGYRTLTRRERREMEQRGEPVPETGLIPVLPHSDPLAEASPLSAVGDIPGPRLASEQSVAEEINQAQASEDGASENSALPPVFGPAIIQGDTHTASARTVGVGLDATHALILPVAPTMDVTGPIGDTGEVLMTGNMPLPRHVSEQALTGALEMEEDHSPYDQADGSSFTTPIRASDAVSSRTIQVDQPMIQKPRWGVASIVLGSSAAILGVSALGLLALALLTDIVDLPF